MTALVVQHHRDLQSWLNNADEVALQRFLNAHDAEFTLVTVEGTVATRAQLDDMFHGVGATAPDTTIEISWVTVLEASGDLQLLRWEERHSDVHGSSTRVVTGVLRADKWLSVHETLIRT